ncbi:MAG: tRNA (adenosine(37)-N6)-threonylcarbamoyltransferase complex ATPase subunit type 1 TsaE [Chloroflexi bacterium]|nr:tRNA (adenosine(37)-N6)-threonylcarbamoyltransferase complex ATPase subunit type 1 TsaE [Chloroflexota bacterium]
MLTKLELLSSSPEETQRIGYLLGSQAQQGDIFLLTGGLGVGKTCLAQGIVWGLGVTEYARSPTFVLVTEYQGRARVYHMDLYRLDDVREILDLGLEEYLLGDGVCIVEWAEKAPDVFPKEHMQVSLEYLDDKARRIILETQDQGYAKRIASMQEQLVTLGVAKWE